MPEQNGATSTSVYYTRAIAAAIDRAMADDSTVHVVGEDVEISEFGTTKGLLEKYGNERVRNTPLSEAAVVGMCLGAAASGLRPIMDLQFASFFYIVMDQVANQTARLRYMSGGQVEVPLVILAGTGPAGSAAAQHSENPHPALMQASGIRVVMPSTPADARGLLLASIADPNPVAFLFDVVLAGTRGPVAEDGPPIALGTADVKRHGTDVTVVAIASLVRTALAVAEELEQSHGISVEVIDPRTLVPLDWATIESSVRRTHRLVVADPARRTCGAAAEVAAHVTESCWGDLVAPPTRVTWRDFPIPFSPVLEAAVLPSADELRQAVIGLVS
jgi:pyruvate/2-oxoglutarate/acetoin dehydrogenase E1 component